jgi:hypothetical protein
LLVLGISGVLRRFALLLALFPAPALAAYPLVWAATVPLAGAVDAQAAYARGLAAYNGTAGSVDKASAAREFAVAANAGHARAQYNLGRMLWTGDGVPRDPRTALAWMQRAAKAGEANAQFVLAQIYESGNGVRKDPQQAHDWLQRAAAGGEPLAQRELGQRLIEGRGMPADPAKGHALIAKAAARSPATGAAPTAPAANLDAQRQSVLDALRTLLDAQGRGDLAAMRAAVSSVGLDAAQLQQLDAAVRRGPRLRFRDLELIPHAVGISGDFALLRYQYRMTVQDAAGESPQAGGNIALLARESGGWKVQQIFVDEALTLASYRRVAGPDPRPRPTSVAATCATPERGPGLIDPDEFRQQANAAIDAWHVDEGKLTRDAVYSAVGHIWLAGDWISNGYTAYERLKTLTVELPADVWAGNTKAALLDMSLMAWGGVQVVAELVPYVDHLTDVAESSLESWRYNAVQRFNYLELLRQLDSADYAKLPKYLILRKTSAAQSALIRSSLHLDRVADWHGRWPALRGIDILSDALLRTDPRLVFGVGVELRILKSENETHFALARDLGLPTARSGPYDDEIAYVPLNLTRRVKGDSSSGDGVLGDFTMPPRIPLVHYRTSCSRGEMTLQLLMEDLTSTEPVRVRNLPFNLIRGAHLVGGPFDQSHGGQLQAGQRVDGIRIQAELLPADRGLTVVPPEILKSECVGHRQLNPEVLAVDTVGAWPSMTLTLQGLAAGTSTLQFHFAAKRTLPALVVSLPVSVVDPPVAAAVTIDGEWTMRLTLMHTTRARTKRPQTEAERRAARDSLNLSGDSSAPVFGDSAIVRVRLHGGMLILQLPDDGSWGNFGSYEVSASDAGVQLLLSGGSDDAEALEGRLNGSANALDGTLGVRDPAGVEVDVYRAQLSR